MVKMGCLFIARLFVFWEYLFKFSVDLLSAKTTGEDGAIRGEEDDVGDASDMVGIGGNLLGVDNLRVGNAVVFDGLQRVFGLVLYGDADDLQAAILVFVVGGDDLRDFHSAGAAP